MQNQPGLSDRTPIGLVARIRSVPTNPSDRELVEAIAGRDRHSMQCLFVRHNVRVYRFIVRLVGDVTTAKDLTSDVFVDVWTQAGKFKGHSSVSTWLLAIARYKAVSALRRRTAETVSIDKLMVVDSGDDPEVTYEKQDRCRLVRECVLKLSHEHREIVDLLYYYEKSMKEVSKITRIPLGTVKSRASYARRRLSDLLVAAGVDA